MKCLVSDTVAALLFSQIPYKHVYQSYEVLCAVEKQRQELFTSNV